MKAKVAERGRATIPKALRRKLGLEADGGKPAAAGLQPHDPVEAVFGSLGRDRSTDELLDELRACRLAR